MAEAKRIALVNGGSKGIGRAIATGLSQAGMDVYIAARDEQTLRSTAKEIEIITRQRVNWIVADITKPESAHEVIKKIKCDAGNVDVLINNGGGPKFSRLLECTSNDWENALQLSLLSAIRFTTEVLPDMKASKWGRIVNISSTLAKEPSPGMILSSTARAGLVAFSKALSNEIAEFGVTINTIYTGGVLTDRLRELVLAQSEKTDTPYQDVLRESQSSIPIGRFAQPDEFAELAIFLCSDKASYITGTAIPVDGGLVKGI